MGKTSKNKRNKSIVGKNAIIKKNYDFNGQLDLDLSHLSFIF